MSYNTFAEAIPTMTYEEQLDLISALVEAVKHGIHRSSAATTETNDHTDSYPNGYFDLFASDPDYPEEPAELSWDLESKKEFF